MKELRDFPARTAEPDLKRLRALQRDDASLQTKRITVLYDQAGSGQIDMDESLREYLRAQQRKLATINQEIALLQSRQQVPLRKFGRNQIEQFTETVRTELLASDSPLRQTVSKSNRKRNQNYQIECANHRKQSATRSPDLQMGNWATQYWSAQPRIRMARPERFELPTPWFAVRTSNGN